MGDRERARDDDEGCGVSAGQPVGDPQRHLGAMGPVGAGGGRAPAYRCCLAGSGAGRLAVARSGLCSHRRAVAGGGAAAAAAVATAPLRADDRPIPKAPAKGPIEDGKPIRASSDAGAPAW